MRVRIEHVETQRSSLGFDARSSLRVFEIEAHGHADQGVEQRPLAVPLFPFFEDEGFAHAKQVVLQVDELLLAVRVENLFNPVRVSFPNGD
jgi:hypothetical protein